MKEERYQINNQHNTKNGTLNLKTKGKRGVKNKTDVWQWEKKNKEKKETERSF